MIVRDDWSTLKKLIFLRGSGAGGGAGGWSTITGNPVAFTAKAAPLRQLQAAFSPVQSGSGDPSPDNVRPISGWSSLTVYHSGADTSNPQTISINLGQTVYSGTVDVVTGVVKARPYYASYNGETLVGPWMSSMDKYAAGATPTAGAQVVDMGGAETTIQLTPQEVSSLLGENNMWSDANGNLTVTYAADPATTPIVGTGKVGQAIIGG